MGVTPLVLSLCEECGVHRGLRLGLGRPKWGGPEILQAVELRGVSGETGHPRGADTTMCFSGFLDFCWVGSLDSESSIGRLVQ